MTKQLWILAGGNGAGKSTFYTINLLARGLPMLNVDQIAETLEPGDPGAAITTAQKWVELKRAKLVETGESFCYETVFSHVSKVDFVAEAKSQGYEVTIIYIHLSSPELNQARVYQRVSEGGHDVPPDKIKARIPRVMGYVSDALVLADQVRLLDNSSHAKPFIEIASMDGGHLSAHVDPLPDWARTMLKL